MSLSIPNTRHHLTQQSSNLKPVKPPRTLETTKEEGDESPRPIRGKVALKVSQFNQNGNHSGGATKNDKETSPTNDKSSSNGSTGTSPVGEASSTTSSTPSTVAQVKTVAKESPLNGDSRSSSVEELATINDDQETADGNTSLLKQPDSTKTKPPPQSVGTQPHYPPPPHLTHHHTDPASYSKSVAYVSLSQPQTQGVPQGIAQGIVPPPSLSQQDHRYMYDHHLAYTHSSVYPSHPSLGYDPPKQSSGRHHHISPPHPSQPHVTHQYIVPTHGYRPHDYGEHHGSGPHDHHMTHRGLPPTMQYQQYTPTPHLKHTRHESYTKNNIGLAHEAAGSGDIKTLVSVCVCVQFVYMHCS